MENCVCQRFDRIETDEIVKCDEFHEFPADLDVRWRELSVVSIS